MEQNAENDDNFYLFHLSLIFKVRNVLHLNITM